MPRRCLASGPGMLKRDRGLFPPCVVSMDILFGRIGTSDGTVFLWAQRRPRGVVGVRVKKYDFEHYIWESAAGGFHRGREPVGLGKAFERRRQWEGGGGREEGGGGDDVLEELQVVEECVKVVQTISRERISEC